MEKLSVLWLAPHLWRWVLLIFPSLALAFWTYYRILAPLTRPARWALWTLRGLAFLLVLLALCQPVVTAILRDSGKPGLAVLCDQSASMGLPAGGDRPGQTRQAQAAEVAQTLAKELGDRFRLHWYGFAESPRPARPDSLAVSAGNTALGGALEEILGQADSRRISGILVVSDGVNTMGRDPVRIASASPVPIFTVPVGPSRSPTDVEIRRVRTNPTAFAGEPLPLQVVLSSWGLGGRSVRLEVKEGGTVLATREVQLLGDRGLEQEIPLEVRPRTPGVSLFDVEVSGARDSIPENDRRQVAVEVLERKTRVLVLCWHLDWDFAFLRRTLEADTTLAYSFLAQVRPGEFRGYGEKWNNRPPGSAADLRDFAVVILVGVDEQGPPAATAEALAGYVRSGGALLLIGGPSRPGGWTAAGPLGTILPGVVGPDPLPSTRALPVALTLEGQRHPATAVRDNPAEAAQLWASLPPLTRPGGGLTAKPGARCLLEYRTQRGSGQPALLTAFEERGKTAWLYGRSFWRWGFLPAGGPSSSDLYPQFLLGLTRWLAEPLSRDRFQVAPGKLVYQSGEPISFAASLWDPAYAPLSGAQIAVEIRPAADSSAARLPATVNLQPGLDAGRYDGEGPPASPGAYRYQAVASEAGSGRELDRVEGKFWVETMGPEFARTWTNREDLQQIAQRSGGRLAEAGHLDELLAQIPRALRRLGRIREIEVWNHWLLFASFVAVLSAEWFLRRRRGLA